MKTTKCQQFQREFLIQLAPIWLACRWRLAGHSLIGKQWPKFNWPFDLMGARDYGAEMRLLANDELRRVSSK